MPLSSTMPVFHFLCRFIAFSPTACGEASTSAPLKTYIVHVHKTPEHVGSHREWHESFLPSGVVNHEARSKLHMEFISYLVYFTSYNTQNV